MREHVFVTDAEEAAHSILRKPLHLKRGAALLYQVTVNDALQVTVDPSAPKRGQAAFETDLCIFETVQPKVAIPRVAMEFKWSVTTHDLITYSAKARKHKQVYPYLRYGMVIGNEPLVPGRAFRHNEALDFIVAAKSVGRFYLKRLLRRLFEDEVEASRRIQEIAFGDPWAVVYRSSPAVLSFRDATMRRRRTS